MPKRNECIQASKWGLQPGPIIHIYNEELTNQHQHLQLLIVL